MASDVLQTISKDQIERMRLMSIEKHELDFQSDMVYEKQLARQEGRKEIIDLLKNGVSLEEIFRDYGS